MVKEFKLDKLDCEIIDILEKDAKTKLHIIAKKLKVPVSTVHFRIQKLESSSIFVNTIKKDFKKLGLGLKAQVVVYVNPKELRAIKRTQVDLAKDIIRLNNVDNVDIITGEGDLLITLRTKDVDELNNILLNKIQSIDGISNTRTLIVLQEIRK